LLACGCLAKANRLLRHVLLHVLLQGWPGCYLM
jgi:hypothetical protein